MDELCSACLCPDRNLTHITDTGFYHVYSQILCEISVYDLSRVCVRVCWECVASLRRHQQFKVQVQQCFSVLLQQIQCGSQDTKLLQTVPNLQIKHQVISIDYPEIKTEFDTLDINYNADLNNHDLDQEQSLEDCVQPLEEQKVLDAKECDDYVKEEDHNDLKTFVNEIEVKKKSERKRKSRVEKVKIPKEKKKKAKLKKTPKVKKKKQKQVENLIKSDAESCDDYEGEYLSTLQDKDVIREELEDVKENIEDNTECDIYQKNEVDMEFGNTELPATEANEPSDVHSKLKRSAASHRASQVGERPQCNECGKVFSSRKTLRYHLNVLHAGNNRYPCPRCGKVYQWKSNLGRHLRSHKARDTGELYCAACDKRFASVATYRQHLAISKQHVSESQFSFTCDECGKKFVSKTRLRDHIDWEHLQKIKFRCQLCNKPFKCHTSLYVHLKNVHRNKGLKDNLCHVCGKSYQNAAKLRYHIVAMHTTQTPYQCEQCSAAFGWYSSLYRHVREVHYKMKVHPSKAKKAKKRTVDTPTHTQPHTQHTLPTHTHALPHATHAHALHIPTHNVLQ
ncbi:hypothetical protein O0L34_g16050 [Tuta absoluta]|nr:hypothetical protein O0L34_g16050 [Tuta absoluta]